MKIYDLSLRLRGLFSIPDIIDVNEYQKNIVSATVLTGFLWSIVYALEGGRYSAEDSTTLIILASIVLFIVAVVLANQHVTLTDKTENPSQAREGSYVHASGEIIESNGSCPAPFTEDEGPIVAWKVEEEKDRLGGNSYVKTVAEGIVSNKFQVDDDDGKITVDFEDGSNQYNMNSIFGKYRDDNVSEVDEIQVNPGEKPPKRIVEFINEDEGIDKVVTDGRRLDLDITHKDGKRRYKQYVFSEGDEIYVRGIYEKNGFEDVIRYSEDGTYIVGDLRENYIEDITVFVHWAVVSSLVTGVIGVLSAISVSMGASVSGILAFTGLGVGIKRILLNSKE